MAGLWNWFFRNVVLPVWFALCIVGCFLMFDLRVYYFWSRLGRWIYERKYLKQAIRQYDTTSLMQAGMRGWIWRMDPWWHGFDMISHPAAFEARCLNGDKEDDGDCDEFSVYIGQALLDMAQRIGSVDGRVISQVSLSAISWMHMDTGKVSGHNVCIFRYLIPGEGYRWAWASNWFECGVLWTRHGKTYESAREVVDHVCDIMGARLIRFARVSIDLKKMYEVGS